MRVKVYRCKKNKEKNRKKKEESVEADQRVSLQNSDSYVRKKCAYIVVRTQRVKEVLVSVWGEE